MILVDFHTQRNMFKIKYNKLKVYKLQTSSNIKNKFKVNSYIIGIDKLILIKFN